MFGHIRISRTLFGYRKIRYIVNRKSAFIKRMNRLHAKVQGPVVQSIVSLTSSLRGQLVKCFMNL